MKHHFSLLIFLGVSVVCQALGQTNEPPSCCGTNLPKSQSFSYATIHNPDAQDQIQVIFPNTSDDEIGFLIECREVDPQMAELDEDGFRAYSRAIKKIFPNTMQPNETISEAKTQIDWSSRINFDIKTTTPQGDQPALQSYTMLNSTGSCFLIYLAIAKDLKYKAIADQNTELFFEELKKANNPSAFWKPKRNLLSRINPAQLLILLAVGIAVLRTLHTLYTRRKSGKQRFYTGKLTKQKFNDILQQEMDNGETLIHSFFASRLRGMIFNPNTITNMRQYWVGLSEKAMYILEFHADTLYEEVHQRYRIEYQDITHYKKPLCFMMALKIETRLGHKFDFTAYTKTLHSVPGFTKEIHTFIISKIPPSA